MKTKPRRVFGRRTVTVDGVCYRLEMGSAGLSIRKKHSRTVRTVTLAALVDWFANGQMGFKW